MTSEEPVQQQQQPEVQLAPVPSQSAWGSVPDAVAFSVITPVKKAPTPTQTTKNQQTPNKEKKWISLEAVAPELAKLTFAEDAAITQAHAAGSLKKNNASSGGNRRKRQQQPQQPQPVIHTPAPVKSTAEGNSNQQQHKEESQVMMTNPPTPVSMPDQKPTGGVLSGVSSVSSTGAEVPTQSVEKRSNQPFQQHVNYYRSSRDLHIRSAIVAQLEFYFSKENLCRDVYLRSHMDADGYVPIQVLAGFNRIRSLTGNCQLIADSIIAYSNTMTVPLQVDTQRERVRLRDNWQTWTIAQRDGPGVGKKVESMKGDKDLTQYTLITPKPSKGGDQSTGIKDALQALFASQAKEDDLVFIPNPNDPTRPLAYTKSPVEEFSFTRRMVAAGSVVDACTGGTGTAGNTVNQQLSEYQQSLKAIGYEVYKYAKFTSKALAERVRMGTRPSPDMALLFAFWADLYDHIDDQTMSEFRMLALQDARLGHRFGIRSWYRTCTMLLLSGDRIGTIDNTYNMWRDLQEIALADLRLGHVDGVHAVMDVLDASKSLQMRDSIVLEELKGAIATLRKH